MVLGGFLLTDGRFFFEAITYKNASIYRVMKTSLVIKGNREIIYLRSVDAIPFACQAGTLIANVSGVSGLDIKLG